MTLSTAAAHLVEALRPVFSPCSDLFGSTSLIWELFIWCHRQDNIFNLFNDQIPVKRHSPQPRLHFAFTVNVKAKVSMLTRDTKMLVVTPAKH